MTVLVLISGVHFESFVIMLRKYLKYSTLSSSFCSIIIAIILFNTDAWLCSLPSVSHGIWRTYIRVIYTGGHCKATRSTTTGWHTHTRTVLGFFFNLFAAFHFSLQHGRAIHMYFCTAIMCNSNMLICMTTPFGINRVDYYFVYVTVQMVKF